MLHPSYKELLERINETKPEDSPQMTSRYTLVIAAAKRARQINSGSEPLVDIREQDRPSTRNLSIAVSEMNQGKVHLLGEAAKAAEETEEAEGGEEASEVSEEPADENVQ